MVLDQCTSNVLRLSALFLLRLYSAWLRKCKGEVGPFYCLSACRRGVSARSHQSLLWHELCSYCRICLSTWPNAIGRELPIAGHPPITRPSPPAVLPSLCLCKLCKCRGSSSDEAQSCGISLTRVVSNTCKPTCPPGMPSTAVCLSQQLHQMHF